MKIQDSSARFNYNPREWSEDAWHKAMAETAEAWRRGANS
jgi:hypothetical protein